MDQFTPHFLETRKGRINFPAYIPVTTFGNKYPLDNLIRPYLPRLAQGIMVSYHYARQMESDQQLPIWVDSGGFASLFRNARIVEEHGLGLIEIRTKESVERVHPKDILDLQEQIADVAFTLDFPIPPGMELEEANFRQRLTIANASWALANRRRRDLPLYACIQAWDAASARECVAAYVGQGFSGYAIGGLVPRSRDVEMILSIVDAVSEVIGDLPLHVFGLGKPEIVKRLYEAGVDSVDSSSYVKLAAEGKIWGTNTVKVEQPSPTDLLHLAICNLAAASGLSLPVTQLQHLKFHTASIGRYR